ncbi:MAG: metalloregulator ArsR/SmtB family transcription factor [Pseudomonadota bacterium]
MMIGEPTQGAFRALADPTRRAILVQLSAQDMTIGEVVDRFDVTRAAIKKHLTVLEQGALITVTTDGRTRVNRLRPEGLKGVIDWLVFFDRFWDEKLANLRTAIENETKTQHEPTTQRD